MPIELQYIQGVHCHLIISAVTGQQPSTAPSIPTSDITQIAYCKAYLSIIKHALQSQGRVVHHCVHVMPDARAQTSGSKVVGSHWMAAFRT